MASGRILWADVQRAFDANGVVQPGALLTVYLNGTTTKASIFAHKDLSTPILNPQTANSAGLFFEQTTTIWASADHTYTVKVSLPDGTNYVANDIEVFGGGSSSAIATPESYGADATGAADALADIVTGVGEGPLIGGRNSSYLLAGPGTLPGSFVFDLNKSSILPSYAPDTYVTTNHALASAAANLTPYTVTSQQARNPWVGVSSTALLAAADQVIFKASDYASSVDSTGRWTTNWRRVVEADVPNSRVRLDSAPDVTYTGTVTMDRIVTTGDFELSNGTIDCQHVGENTQAVFSLQGYDKVRLRDIDCTNLSLRQDKTDYLFVIDTCRDVVIEDFRAIGAERNGQIISVFNASSVSFINPQIDGEGFGIAATDCDVVTRQGGSIRGRHHSSSGHDASSIRGEKFVGCGSVSSTDGEIEDYDTGSKIEDTPNVSIKGRTYKRNNIDINVSGQVPSPRNSRIVISGNTHKDCYLYAIQVEDAVEREVFIGGGETVDGALLHGLHLTATQLEIDGVDIRNWGLVYTISRPEVVTGGTGYQVGDLIPVSGGGYGESARLYVWNVDGSGVIQTGGVTHQGIGTVSVTGGSGGSGHAVGDVLTLAGGTASTAATATVTAVSSGVITAATVTNPGVFQDYPSSGVLTQASSTGSGTGASFTYSVVGFAGTYDGNYLPPNPVSQAVNSTSNQGTAHGTGATFTLYWGGLSRVKVLEGGTGHNVGDTITLTSGTGSAGIYATAPVVTVTATDNSVGEGAGRVVAVSVTTPGEYSTFPSDVGPMTWSGGGRNNLQLQLIAGADGVGYCPIYLSSDPGIVSIQLADDCVVTSAYVVNEIITLEGGVYTTPAKVQVTKVDPVTGRPLAWKIPADVYGDRVRGVYTTFPAQCTQASTTGSGAGAVWNVQGSTTLTGSMDNVRFEHDNPAATGMWVDTNVDPTQFRIGPVVGGNLTTNWAQKPTPPTEMVTNLEGGGIEHEFTATLDGSGQNVWTFTPAFPKGARSAIVTLVSATPAVVSYTSLTRTGITLKGPNSGVVAVRVRGW